MTRPPYFFIHVMKTGGTTFRAHAQKNFAPRERYPEASIDPDVPLAKVSIPLLLSQPAKRLDRIRIYTGHLPYSTVELLDRPLTVMTILRDPVERAISHLKQHQEENAPGRSLEEVYEDPEVQGPQIRDHQVRMFALAPTDEIEGFYSLPLVIDDARFTRACDNLDRLDLVGFQHRYDEFQAALVERYGWTLARPSGPMRASAPMKVSRSLRRRLAEENSADVAFWEHALSRAARRSRRWRLVR